MMDNLILQAAEWIKSVRASMQQNKNDFQKMWDGPVSIFSSLYLVWQKSPCYASAAQKWYCALGIKFVIR